MLSLLPVDLLLRTRRIYRVLYELKFSGALPACVQKKRVEGRREEMRSVVLVTVTTPSNRLVVVAFAMTENAQPGPSKASDLTAPAQTGHARGARGMMPSAMLRRRLTHVPARLPILIRLPNQKLKSVELHPGRVVSLGKFGSFKADDIIGLPYGLTFEIVSRKTDDEANVSDGAVDTVEPSANGKGGKAGQRGTGAEEVGDVRVVLSGNLLELEDNQATNEKIGDGKGPEGHAQTMTYLDIRALKEAGTEGKDIVQREVASNMTFAQRTSWSQQKFIMRKEAKHMRLFTPLPPTLTNVTRHHHERFERDLSDKVRGLRADSLANILSLAGVAPGRRFIVVDGVGGLLTGAMLERMGGEGRILLLNDADSPPSLDLMAQFDLPTNSVNSVMRSMHWACTESDWQSLLDPGESADTTPAGKPANDRDRQRFRKRRAALTGLERVRKEFFDGEFDGLVVASPYEPVSIVERLLPYLGGSSNVVVHSPYLQPLVEAHALLRMSHALINVSVTEPFQRRYQVLPGRTHPEMMTSATAGYILHAIRVLTEEETLRAVEEREKAVEETLEDAQYGGSADTKARNAAPEAPESKRSRLE